MSYSVELEKLAKDKQKAREVVKEILNFGVNEQQKLQIIYELSLTLETVGALKSINEVLKLYRKTINKDEDTDNNKKVLISKLIID